MKQKTDSQGVPYSYLVDNIKVLLIFLVVFNHIIAFQLVKVDVIVRYVWYAITIFHMPAFVFMSGYLSKKPQDVLKNVKNLLIPYILGYSLTWYAYVWLGRSMDYELLRPSGTVMWYVLALFIYRLTIEALFVAGYLWKSDYTKVVRKFKGKWVLIPISGLLLYAIPNFMMENNIPIDIFRGNHTYQLCGMDNITGMLIRLLMYLVSFVLILTFLALIPDIKLPITFIGRNTMGIYFFHYPIMIVLNGLLLLSIPKMLNVWVLFGVSWIFVLVLGSAPVSFIYNGMLNLLIFIFFKREKQVQDEGLEDEYDEDEHYEIIRKRKKAIEELAATLEEEENARKVEDNVAVVLEKEDPLEKLNKEEFFVDEDFDTEADSEDAESPQAFEKLQELDELLELVTPQEEEETQTEKE